MATAAVTFLDRPVKVFFPLHIFFNVGKRWRADFGAIVATETNAFFIIGHEKTFVFGKMSRMAIGAQLTLYDRLMGHFSIFNLLPDFLVTPRTEIRHPLFQHIGPCRTMWIVTGGTRFLFHGRMDNCRSLHLLGKIGMA